MAVQDKTETKDKAVAFVNWSIAGGKIRSTKGFTIFDNTYTTKSDRALIELAKKHGGKVRVVAEFDIRLNEQEDAIDLDSIEVLTD